MESVKPAVMVIDDEEDILLLYKNILKDNYNVKTCSSGKKALKLIQDEHYDLLILDVLMPEMNGIDVLKEVRKLDLGLDVIMVTASKDIRPAVDSLKLGAYDYIIKPFEVEDLLSTIKKAIERRSILKENLYLKQALDERASLGKLLGKSKQIKRIYDIIESVSDSDSTVLITGESGTGKEIVAETLHNKSKRASRPYVIVNCAAIPDNLLESELFGHEKGSFTGALERHLGKFELADGGTIFLDEIGEMPLSMQAKLLRVVQECCITRVGGERSIPVDVRIVAATNVDITNAISSKKFREDLYYRLNVIPIHMPPLRERIEDLPIFINHFIDKYNKELNKNIKNISNEAMNILLNYQWPGNVRELENLVERIITLSKNGTIEAVQIPNDLIKGYSVSEGSFKLEEESLAKAVSAFEKKIIIEALTHSGWNQTNAAKNLGIHRTTLISKMESLGIKR